MPYLPGLGKNSLQICLRRGRRSSEEGPTASGLKQRPKFTRNPTGSLGEGVCVGGHAHEPLLLKGPRPTLEGPNFGRSSFLRLRWWAS
eukprot:8438315-Alexandrium_andersonii.AAC.1